MNPRRLLFVAMLAACAGVAHAQTDPASSWDPQPPGLPPEPGSPPPGLPPEPGPQPSDLGAPPHPPPLPGDIERRGPPPEGAILDWWLQGMKERNPEKYEELQRLRRENPGELRRRMREYRQDLQQGHGRRPFDSPENKKLREMERESKALAERARKAGPEEREAASQALREHLEKLFDLREAERARQIEHMEKRLAELEQLVETRQANRDRIIDMRMQELLGSAELEW